MPRQTNTEALPVMSPDWESFTALMFRNAAYQRVSAASDKLIVGRIETFCAAIQSEETSDLRHLWAGMLLTCPEASRPNETEAQEWQAIAEQSEMSFAFNDMGFFAVADPSS